MLPFSLCILVSIASHRIASHCYNTVTARYSLLDASACSQEFNVRVACYLDGGLRAPWLVPRRAAATWNRLPPRLDVASDAVLLRGPCFTHSVNLYVHARTASTATSSAPVVLGIVLLPRMPKRSPAQID
jgi:hypothetical protein